jgi:hypothetical protein
VPPPFFMDPEFRALLLQLLEEVEMRLGLSDPYVAIVVHQRAGPDSDPVYEIGIGCDRSPEFIREVRRAFPPRARGGARVTLGKLGGVEMVGLRANDLKMALAHYRAKGDSA